MLGKAITLLESSRPADEEMASALIDKCLPYSGNSIRVGISGVPGVGKSSFIESFGSHLTSEGKKLAVLAVDPSSQKSGGSILGDKTRMEKLATDTMAFIRPSPTSGSLGGVAQKTRESIILCEAAGYEVILVETVGVGQSEVAVRSMVDFFLLLMLSGAGDELQGIKRGIMEIADSLVITKTDGDNTQAAKQAARTYKSAMHLFPPTPSGWIPQVLTCSAHQNEGMEAIWKMIHSYQNTMTHSGFFEEERQRQAIHWIHENIKDQLLDDFYSSTEVRAKMDELTEAVKNQQLSPKAASNSILSYYKSL